VNRAPPISRTEPLSGTAGLSLSFTSIHIAGRMREVVELTRLRSLIIGQRLARWRDAGARVHWRSHQRRHTSSAGVLIAGIELKLRRGCQDERFPSAGVL